MIKITEMTKRDTERVLKHLNKALAIIEKYEAVANYGEIIYNRSIDPNDFAVATMYVNRLYEDSFNG